MFDIGLGEILVLGVLALLIFGPEQLPKVAAQAGRMVRQLRETAGSARRELTEGTGLDSIGDDLKSLADLHPKRILSSSLSDGASGQPATSTGNGSRPAGTAADSAATPGGPTGSSQPSTRPASAPAAFDPDAT
jgi:sec-independent protein translocase protein TatB